MSKGICQHCVSNIPGTDVCNVDGKHYTGVQCCSWFDQKDIARDYVMVVDGKEVLI